MNERFGCPKRILVADEDDEFRDVVVAALVEDGHDVVALRDGAELTECLEAIGEASLRAPSMIAIGADARRPSSALETLERIRGDGWATPTVLMQWFIERDTRTRLQIARGACIVPKPFNMNEFRHAALVAEERATCESGVRRVAFDGVRYGRGSS
jgi:DNA-binding response OmpR family regulator